MRILVESLKRLYRNGLNGETPYVTKEQVDEMMYNGKISEDEYRIITEEK